MNFVLLTSLFKFETALSAVQTPKVSRALRRASSPLAKLAPAVTFGGAICLFTRHLYTLPGGGPSKIPVYLVIIQTDSFNSRSFEA
jgi:hypothetical protein